MIRGLADPLYFVFGSKCIADELHSLQKSFIKTINIQINTHRDTNFCIRQCWRNQIMMRGEIFVTFVFVHNYNYWWWNLSQAPNAFLMKITNQTENFIKIIHKMKILSKCLKKKKENDGALALLMPFSTHLVVSIFREKSLKRNLVWIKCKKHAQWQNYKKGMSLENHLFTGKMCSIRMQLRSLAFIL